VLLVRSKEGDMKFRSRRIIVDAIAMAVVLLLGFAFANGQTAPQEKPQMADDIFKNVQVLKGLTVDEFMGTMGFIAASLSMNCIDCHSLEAASDVTKYAVDTPIKQTARKMILMVKSINAANFGGKQTVTCYSCHRSQNAPKAIPSLAEQYGTPPPEDPDEVEIIGEPRSGAPSVDQVFDKYIQALGGAQQLAKLTSFVAKGTYEGFDTGDEKAPVEVYAKTPNQLTAVVHIPQGDSIRTFDGRNGWMTSTGTLLPIPVFALAGGNLEGAKLDAELSFPGQIKQTLTGWHTGFPPTFIDDNEVDIVEGTNAAKTSVKLYFDKKSGLLVRLVRYQNTAIGTNPTQVDYSDYRDVAGVKMPFHYTVTWTDGRSTTELSSIQPNAPIDASKFARPAAASRSAGTP
jgi:photosynthetic reaction center cytochrome c subunit